MTLSFAEQVRTAIANAEEAANTEPARRFRAVLEEFVAGISERGVGARLQSGQDARRLTVYLYPPHRPARVNLMLAFFLDGDNIVVSGDRIRSPEELQRWLLGYIQRHSFIESLSVLREEAKLPVEARLRVDREAPHAVGDVLVAVSPADQEKLDAATVGSDVELAVERIEFPGNGQYVRGTNYSLLESAGLFVGVDSVELSGDKLQIKGKRA